MLGQVFELSDIPRLGALAFIEIALSADNAIVLGILTRSLPEKLRSKALYIGLISAVFLRAGALFAVSLILHSAWLELIGAGYLLYLAIKHFVQKPKASQPKKSASFWKTVVLIECFDLAFALDSIIAGVAFIATPTYANHFINPKLWIVYIGGMLGVVAIRYAADVFSRLISRFQNLEHSAHLLIAWIAIKLIFNALAPDLAHFEIFFWIVFTCILLIGFLKKQLR